MTARKLICSCCGRPSATDPGPKCARNLLDGKISWHEVSNASGAGGKVISAFFKNYKIHDEYKEFVSVFAFMTDENRAAAYKYANVENPALMFKAAMASPDKMDLVYFAHNEKAKSCHKEFLKGENLRATAEYVKTANLSDQDIVTLLRTKDPGVISAIVSNRRLSFRAIKILLKTEGLDEETKIRIIAHEECSSEDRIKLFQSSDRYIMAMLTNPGIKLSRGEYLAAAGCARGTETLKLLREESVKHFSDDSVLRSAIDLRLSGLGKRAA